MVAIRQARTIMIESGRRVPWKGIWVAVAVAAIMFAGEFLLTLAEELIELIVDVTQAAFMLLFEKGFGLPYEKAQGRAAWTSLGLLIVAALFGAWRIAPWVKRVSARIRQECGGARDGLIGAWRSAQWYQKVLYVLGGLLILSSLMLVI